jgi:dihydrofolate reductase
MPPLIFSMTCSLDGYVEDATGSLGWTAPDPEVEAFLDDNQRSIGTYLFGRRMYETMRGWDDPGRFYGDSAAMRDYAAIWESIDKVVYSRSLAETSTRRTRLERSFEADAVRRLKEAADRAIEVAGPGLASEAFRAGLVDEVHLFVAPVILGGGKRALPDDVRIDLSLDDEHRFSGGTVYLRYRVT